MKKITRKETDYLIDHGVVYGEEGIHSTKNHNHYFVCESFKVKQLLNQFASKYFA